MIRAIKSLFFLIVFVCVVLLCFYNSHSVKVIVPFTEYEIEMPLFFMAVCSVFIGYVMCLLVRLSNFTNSILKKLRMRQKKDSHEEDSGEVLKEDSMASTLKLIKVVGGSEKDNEKNEEGKKDGSKSKDKPKKKKSK